MSFFMFSSTEMLCSTMYTAEGSDAEGHGAAVIAWFFMRRVLLYH